MSEKGISLEDAHGDTVVGHLDIVLYRSGAMRLAGSITDEAFARAMLDTARGTLDNYHIQQKLGNRSGILVAADDTALVGTPEEKRLIAARDDLDNLMRGKR